MLSTSMVRGIITEENAAKEDDVDFADARSVHAVSCLFRTLKGTWRLSAVIKWYILRISGELMTK